MKFYVLSIISSILLFGLCFFLTTRVTDSNFLNESTGKMILALVLIICYFLGGFLIKKLVPEGNSSLCAILFGETPAFITFFYAVLLMIFGWHHEESFAVTFIKWILALLPLTLVSYLGAWLR